MIKEKFFNFKDDLFDKHYYESKDPEQFKKIVNYLINLALCHTLQKAPRSETYSASSPDELALVHCAKHFGITFSGRPSPSRILLTVKLPNS